MKVYVRCPNFCLLLFVNECCNKCKKQLSFIFIECLYSNQQLKITVKMQKVAVISFIITIIRFILKSFAAWSSSTKNDTRVHVWSHQCQSATSVNWMLRTTFWFWRIWSILVTKSMLAENTSVTSIIARLCCAGSHTFMPFQL